MKKAPAKKAPAKKSAAPSKKAPARKAPAKKAPARKSAAPSKKAPARKAPAKKAPAKKSAAPSKKAPARKAPVKKGSSGRAGSPFDASFLGAQRELLLSERETLTVQAAALRDEADALARDREPGDVQFDDESGEGDTLAVERDFDLARAAAALHTIEEIDAALERMDAGSYGICEYSGQAIPKERLRAIPWARERVEYKTRSFR